MNAPGLKDDEAMEIGTAMIDQVIGTFLPSRAEEEGGFSAGKVQPASFGLAPSWKAGSRTVLANLVGTTRGHRYQSWSGLGREDGRGRTK